jgi:hypothetical protein
MVGLALATEFQRLSNNSNCAEVSKRRCAVRAYTAVLLSFFDHSLKNQPQYMSWLLAEDLCLLTDDPSG